MARARAVASLVASGALALYVASGVARHAATLGDEVDRLDGDLQPLQRTLRPGDRVAVVVAGPEDHPLFAVLPYALSPATVVRVRLADCVRPGPGACAGGARYLFLPGRSPARAAAFGAPLGYAPALTMPLGTFLEGGR